MKAYNIELAADTLHKILNNPELIATNKVYHDNIVEEAKSYGKYLESNWQQIKYSMQQPGMMQPPMFGMPPMMNYGMPYQPNIMFADPNRLPNGGNAYKAPNFNNKGNK